MTAQLKTKLICRNCDLAYHEEPDSPNPPNFRLFRCPNCQHRLGILSIASEAMA